MSFMVIPAIDIQNGKAVRLRQGRAEDSTVFSDSPLEVARRFAAMGASRLHVVDLDGAFLGKPANTDIICRIACVSGVQVQVGGGIRNYDTAARYLGAGVSRVVLGTSIVRDPEEVTRITRAYPGQVAAGIDARDGRVAIRGWVEVTGLLASDLARRIEEWGVSCFIYTDISRDGMMVGPNFDAIREFAGSVSVPVIASGGVTALDDLRAIKAMEDKGVVGAIIGRALYDETIDLSKALELEQG
ncbi:MAG: 1-(5-phosphoribosyl)-5-[(5-phosphoribosylamino)methylideneamino]imidazole-4-carboxamide isomerase [Syntrophorhabdaceae bacterium]|nr:1-(5-phosphoribosyl)-5-[(5-phosphoribosylamino)methylideneamino]imidazole-4-carboxamide isomerase [Syntrophorhabdaceae bacterium]